MTSANGRIADHPIDALFLERWSPRAFTGEPIPRETLMTILEAARWAPSSFNAQPWRFVYALRDTPEFDRLLGLLIERNQLWAKNAAALIFVGSKTTMLPPKAEAETPSLTHSFDAGAAWAQLALQTTRLGWHSHGMAGFDHERAGPQLGFPANYKVEAAIAIGRIGDRESLPESMRALETPSARRPLAEIAAEGRFPEPAS